VVVTPYWAAARLVSIAADNWGGIDGEAATAGINYFDLEFDRFLNVIYWWTIQRVKDQARFISELNRVPAGAKVTAQDLDDDAEGFMAFASAFGIPPPAASGVAPPDGLTSPGSADEG
jgi:hypothetical protein